MDPYIEGLPSVKYRLQKDGTVIIDGYRYPGIIARFRGDHYYLSNFYPHAPIWFDDKEWPSSEHLYQAWKTKDIAERKRIRTAANAGVAKQLGRQCTIRKDWLKIRLPVMKKVVGLKYAQHPSLKERLMDTRRLYIVEGNRHRDNFFGQDIGEGKSGSQIGHNHLGRIHMRYRLDFLISEVKCPNIAAFKHNQIAMSRDALEDHYDLPIGVMKHWVLEHLSKESDLTS